MKHLVARTIEGCLRLGNRTQKRDFLESGNVYAQFEAQRAQIEELLIATKYFHGTGARHYANNGGSKYDGTSDSAHDSLGNLLGEGLKPQEDIYNERFETGSEISTSLTKNRLYARLYSEYFLHENEQLNYQYGSRPFLWSMFLANMVRAQAYETLSKPFTEAISGFCSHFTKKAHEDKRVRRGKIAKWTDSFRSDGRYRTRPVSAILFGKSDIPDNHPVIIGVKDGAFEPLHIKQSGAAAYEVRSGEVITPDQFTHMQVPLAHVATVREKIAGLSSDIPIVPIEFSELIDSEKRLWELLKTH